MKRISLGWLLLVSLTVLLGFQASQATVLTRAAKKDSRAHLVRIECKNSKPAPFETHISALVNSNQELRKLSFKTIKPNGRSFDERTIKKVKADTELSNQEAIQFDVSAKSGGLEPEILAVPMGFERLQKFQAVLKTIPDGWGSPDSVDVKMSCARVPVRTSQVHK